MTTANARPNKKLLRVIVVYLSDSIATRATGHIVRVFGKFRLPALLIPKTASK